MDTELKAIQQVRGVLNRQSLNQSQQLRVLNYVLEGIYRAQQHEKDNTKTASLGTASLGGPAWAGDSAQQRLKLAEQEPPSAGNADPMVRSTYGG